MGRGGSLDAQFVDFRHGEEGLSVNKHVVLTKAGNGAERRGCVSDNLDNVVVPDGPAIVQNTTATNRIVHLFSIHGNLTLSGRDGPDNGHVVLLATASRACQTICECLTIGESKSPVSIKREIIVRVIKSGTSGILIFLTHQRMRLFVVAMCFPLATAEKSIWYTGKRGRTAAGPGPSPYGTMDMLMRKANKHSRQWGRSTATGIRRMVRRQAINDRAQVLCEYQVQSAQKPRAEQRKTDPGDHPFENFYGKIHVRYILDLGSPLLSIGTTRCSSSTIICAVVLC